ncbi:MAG: cytochrome b/b6 domain-containing protein [Rhodobacteraceae bacterium]|nr:cytochrome b/b6 domain-containing protein [Paracoccaceae bacterium]
MRNVRVWDPFVRMFHWSLVILFAANAIWTNPEKLPHHVIGYAILALVVLRVLWGFAGPRHARFADFPPSPSAALDQVREIATGARRVHLGHSPLGALMIYNMLATLVVIAVSGYMMTTVTWFGIEWVEEVHKAAVTWAEISAVAHIAAVMLESRRLGVNLPRAMVTGTKKVHDPDHA